VGAAAIVAAAASLWALGLEGCGATPAATPREALRHEPHWQDVFDTMPELLIALRPQGLRQDKVYGPLLNRAVEAAREQSRVVAAARTLDALVDADEVIAGVRPDSPDHAGDIVLVARGVRADLDPGKLVDADGRPLWEPGPGGRVRELVLGRDPHDPEPGASLFELPGRTWVVALGNARPRARDAFAHPLGRPEPDLDREALAIARLDGPALVRRWRLLQESGRLAAAGRRLQSVTLALPPGENRTVRATLSYADEDAAAFAGVAIPEAFRELARAKPDVYGWLGGATVERPDKRVIITAPVPLQLIGALPHPDAATPPPQP
jgi:hypothetical protein